MNYIRTLREPIGTDGNGLRREVLPFGRQPGGVRRNNPAEPWRAEVQGSVQRAAVDAPGVVEGPDMRARRIANLREDIAAGRYGVSSKDVAQKIFGKMVSEGG